MDVEEKCKIVLSVYISFEFSIDCINQNDFVSKDKFVASKKKLPNNLFDEKFGVELYVDSDSFEVLVTLIQVKRSLKTFCEKCSRVVSQTNQCRRCLIKYHQKSIGVYKVCYSCNITIYKKVSRP